jgi:divalent metal cation (Fe/Co/Zn/Cd) transporter
VIFLSGAFVTYEAIRKIINPEPITYLKASMIVMIISIILTLGLIAYLYKVYKKSNNLVIK